MSSHDPSSYLRGYVAGYWEGWDFAVDEGEVTTAIGSALAPTTGSAADPPRPLLRCAQEAASPGGAPPAGGSPAPPASSLAALRQAAAGDGFVLNQIDAIVFQQGSVHALRVVVELLRHEGEFDAARVIESMIRGDVETGGR